MSDSSPSSEGELDRAMALLRAASDVVVLTGAGISTDSGIPDFRGPNGVWTKNPAAEKRATIDHYMGDRDVRVAAWRSRLDARAWSAEPNRAHLALAEFERHGTLTTLITQNIDGLHHAAGSSAQKVIEIHGSIREVVCMSCDYRDDMQIALNRVRGGEEDPPCPICGEILKSATISFGQSLVATDLRRAETAASGCDLMIAIGSTLSVYPIAAVVPVAAQTGAKVIIINGSETEMDHLANVVVRGPIGEIVPALFS